MPITSYQDYRRSEREREERLERNNVEHWRCSFCKYMNIGPPPWKSPSGVLECFMCGSKET